MFSENSLLIRGAVTTKPGGSKSKWGPVLSLAGKALCYYQLLPLNTS